MKKVKTIMLAITLACLAECSSDDDSKSNNGELVSCDFIAKPYFNFREIFIGTRLCGEVLIKDIEKAGSSVSAYEANCKEIEGRFSNKGCPSGSVKICDGEYLYDDKFKEMTCDEIMGFHNNKQTEVSQ